LTSFKPSFQSVDHDHEDTKLQQPNLQATPLYEFIHINPMEILVCGQAATLPIVSIMGQVSSPYF